MTWVLHSAGMIEFQSAPKVFFDLVGLILFAPHALHTSACMCVCVRRSHYTASARLKVDHYLLNRLPNKKRLIPLKACIKTLEAWRRSNIHHN